MPNAPGLSSNIGGNSMTGNVPGAHQTQPATGMYHPAYGAPPPVLYSQHPSTLQAAQQRQIKSEEVKNEGGSYGDGMGAGIGMSRNPGMDTVGGGEDDDEPVPLFNQLIDPNAHPQMPRPPYPQNQYHPNPRASATAPGGGAGNPVNDPTPRTNYVYQYVSTVFSLSHGML